MDDIAASGIVLAGGASRRMGEDKAWIEFEGRALIERVVARLKELCGEVIVVANEDERYTRLRARLIHDVFPGTGSLGGIYSGLSAAERGYALVVACDMPFLNPDLLRYELALARDFDVVVPSAPDPYRPVREHKPKREPGSAATAKEMNLHPLHAVYSRRCLEPIERSLQKNDLRLISFHDAVRVRVVDVNEVDRFDPEHLSFFNANTPQQLELARSLAARAQADTTRYESV